MTGWMPPEAPLAHPRQDLGRGFTDTTAPGTGRIDLSVMLWRAAAFVPAACATVLLLWGFLTWFATDGTTWAEAVLAALIGLGFFWIALTFTTVLGGALSMQFKAPAAGAPVRPLDIALVVPVHEEAAWDVFGNAAAMLEALERQPRGHSYSLYLISDSRGPRSIADEEAAFVTLRERLPGRRVFYRRRATNTDRKVGNIADWLTRWGGAHEAMVLLDADSLMGPGAIGDLADAMSRDPSAGLIQSAPRLIGAQTLFARAQQFSNAIYGAALAEGLARWTGGEGNYWGHNAIIRIRAFASSAGLPHLRGSLILSHDFVEAGLLRRAGWTVRFLPRIRGSFEETPPSLIDHCLRDRRWCRGNMQHLGLLGTRGFHALSRFHLFHGAVGYLLSPLWLTLLTLWAVTGVSAEKSVINYFSPENPTMPNWPEMSPVDHVWLMLVLYGLLLAPKLIGAVALVAAGTPVARLGGAGRFVASLALEIVLSVAYAPILMVQQSKAVLAALLGLRQDWTPKSEGTRRPLGDIARFHWVETGIGGLLAAGMATGYVSPWLSPIMISLLLAVPLSVISSMPLPRLLPTPQEVRPPLVASRARRWREELRAAVAPVAAE
ncbi:glucans biosynthesis glucosyltransferase MdoH [Jannaschia aquimarina]|uniref:Glucans biosynthesis glucosyltransferase H n=1 Tax=Jannaschia aquimarina TaxID=935700 RepID=A0A0D1D783_9RHOB|nr:glucans biosynthesis glucosyltransferase MdoH [Jannaschia aquimarina]KIT15798.1 Glucans biosynthesis glucosyltransferase H [Jannaschia aquimarina]SNT42887.1 membrane glycosyltransferase [Jannaschia aquimarina]